MLWVGTQWHATESMRGIPYGIKTDSSGSIGIAWHCASSGATPADCWRALGAFAHILSRPAQAAPALFARPSISAHVVPAFR